MASCAGISASCPYIVSFQIRHWQIEDNKSKHCSKDPFRLGVHLLESFRSAFVKNNLGWQALVFIVVVCVHAISELFHIVCAPLLEDGLTRGSLIFSWETKRLGLQIWDHKNWVSMDVHLHDNAFIYESWLLLGATEHVDHIFHGHLLFLSY